MCELKVGCYIVNMVEVNEYLNVFLVGKTSVKVYATELNEIN